LPVDLSMRRRKTALYVTIARMRGLPLLITLASAILVLTCARASVATEPPRVGAYELGLQGGYGFAMFKNSQYVTFLPRVSRVMLVTSGDHPGVLTFGIEGLANRIYANRHAMQVGGGLLLRYRLVRDGIRPYAELAGGMLYNDLAHFNLGSRVLFSVQAALGLEFPLSERLAATAGYRFLHVSNAGQTRANPGLNSNSLVVGVSYLLD